MNYWKDRAELPVKTFTQWLGVREGKFYAWKNRYGKVNEHNGQIPRDWWLEDWEKQAILDFHQQYPLEGYRRLTFMLLDQDVVAVSPASVYRVLKEAGVIGRRNVKPSQKGKPASCSRSDPTSTGISTSRISTSAGRSITSARSSTAAAATSSTGRSANR